MWRTCTDRKKRPEALGENSMWLHPRLRSSPPLAWTERCSFKERRKGSPPPERRSLLTREDDPRGTAAALAGVRVKQTLGMPRASRRQRRTMEQHQFWVVYMETY